MFRNCFHVNEKDKTRFNLREVKSNTRKFIRTQNSCFLCLFQSDLTWVQSYIAWVKSHLTLTVQRAIEVKFFTPWYWIIIAKESLKRCWPRTLNWTSPPVFSSVVTASLRMRVERQARRLTIDGTAEVKVRIWTEEKIQRPISRTGTIPTPTNTEVSEVHLYLNSVELKNLHSLAHVDEWPQF